MSMRLLFPGSFDPPHLGHLDVMQRAAAIAHGGGGELLVAIAEHPDKPGWLPVSRRIALVQALCRDIPGTRVVSYRGATVRFAQEHAVTTLVRGLRNPLDFEHEKSMAEVNRSHGFDTMFFMTAGVHAHLSSHLVRAAHSAELPLTGLVPPLVASALS
jgi:pantetheine-phosphate adenylyltransferase